MGKGSGKSTFLFRDGTAKIAQKEGMEDVETVFEAMKHPI